MKFTLFTGCYNSANFIERVFKSLKSQEYKNFEWIAIDDASKDNTVELLLQFQSDNPELDIKIIELKENVGVANNRSKAINMAMGDFFITWDHDDVQLPDQLSLFNENWKKFKNENIANLFGFCQNQNGEILGKQFLMGNHVSNYFTHYKKFFMSNNGNQEKHVCARVDILKKYIDQPFNEGLKPNGETLWAKVALKYDSVFINEPVRVYFIEESNQNNMSNMTRSQNAERIYKTKSIWVNNFLKGIKNEPTLKLRLFFAMTFYGFLANKNLRTILSDIESNANKVMIFITAIPAKILLWKMKQTGKGL